jgi:urease accessory protein
VSWKARLALTYRREGEQTLAHDLHEGPLRVLQRLYPEGPGVCHHVVLHPPGGVVGGDELHLQATLGAGSHALITTPGATRFYRSDGAQALQSVRLTLEAGARLEWLPMETIAYPGCDVHNQLHLDLAPGAEAMGWDLLALGLPAGGQAWDKGRFVQQLDLPGVWRERGLIDAGDTALLKGPLGLAGQGVLGLLWFAGGQALARREDLLDAAREVVAGDALARTTGVTAPQPAVVVLRVLAPRVEPAMALLAQVRAAWRLTAWQLAANPPRIWRT